MRRPTVPEVLPLARAYIAEHPTGGSLHVALEDGNLRDSDLIFCYRWAMIDGRIEGGWDTGPIDHAGAALALLLLAMSPTQRRKVYRSA